MSYLLTHSSFPWPDVWPSWAQCPKPGSWVKKRQERSGENSWKEKRMWGKMRHMCVHVCQEPFPTHVRLIILRLQLTLQECRAANTCPTPNPKWYINTHTHTHVEAIHLLITVPHTPTFWQPVYDTPCLSWTSAIRLFGGGGGNPRRHLTDTEKMPWSQWRDAANEKHMTRYECSHLNNSWVGGRQRGCAISAGLSLTEVQSAQHFSKPSDI